MIGAELENLLSEAFKLTQLSGRKADAARLLREALASKREMRIIADAKVADLRKLKQHCNGNLARRCHVSSVYLDLLESALPQG